MKLNNLYLSFFVVFIFISSSLAEDPDNDYMGSGDDGINEEYGSGDNIYDNSDTSDLPEVPDEEEQKKAHVLDTNVGKGDSDMDFEVGPSHPDTEVKTTEDTDVGQGHRGQFSIKHPAVLALIIGGIIFFLLMILLLIMFVVYRLRKKDEGSYALDENMKKKSRNLIYTKPPLQNEFFA